MPRCLGGYGLGTYLSMYAPCTYGLRRRLNSGACQVHGYILPLVPAYLAACAAHC